MELQARLLNSSQIKQVYHVHMKKDFPKNELRPLNMIKKLKKAGVYYTYGIFEENELCAYGYLWEDKDTNLLLFDYFAVCAGKRGIGYGSNAMQVILEACSEKAGLILEVENPAAAVDEEEREIRKRRIKFYEKCGMKMSDVRILLFGVEYCIMYREMQKNNIQENISAVMQRLYRNMLPDVIYKKMLKIL